MYNNKHMVNAARYFAKSLKELFLSILYLSGLATYILGMVIIAYDTPICGTIFVVFCYVSMALFSYQTNLFSLHSFKNDLIKIFISAFYPISLLIKLTEEVIKAICNIIYAIFNLMENSLLYPSIAINFILEKTSIKNYMVLFLITLSCILILAFGNNLGINFNATLIACFTFAIMACISIFTKKSTTNNYQYTPENYHVITNHTKLMYVMLSAASALIVFGLESSQIYSLSIPYLVIAIILPTILISLYCYKDIDYKAKNLPSYKIHDNGFFVGKFIANNFQRPSVSSLQPKL